MPRWLQIVLTLALFAIIMLAVRAVPVATLPGALDWLREHVGHGGIWLLFAAIIIPCAIYGYWPRDPEGRIRPLLSNRNRFPDR